MKRLLLFRPLRALMYFSFLGCALLASLPSMAQAPRGFNYQAVVRGENGRLLENRTVGVRITIHQGSADGNTVYLYTSQLQTNANGLLSIVVGDNSEAYDTIRWLNGPYFLVSEIDPTGGTNYTLQTSQQIHAVPYAEHAREADRVSEAFTYDETDPAFRAWGYAWDSIVGAPTTIAWDSITGRPATIEWDSITGAPTTIAWDSVTGRPTTIAWDSITGRPTTIAWDSVTGVPTTIAWDSVTGAPTTITWDSITGVPSNLSQLVNDPHLNPVLQGDTLFLLTTSDTVNLTALRTTTLPWDSITGVPTTIAWDSIVGHRDSLSLFVNDITIDWDSVAGRPTNLSQFTNDLTITWDSVIGHRDSLSLFVNDITISWDSVTGKPTTIAWDSVTGKPTTIEWDSVTNRPTLLSQFTNDITIAWDSVTGKPTTIEWDSVTGHRDSLSLFVNDITIEWDSVLNKPTTIAWDSVTGKPTTIEWDSVVGHRDSLSLFVNDITIEWDSVTNRPTLLSQFTNDITIAWDSVTGKPTTIVWDSVVGHRDSLSLFVNDITIEWDSVTGKPTTIEWDSVTGKPTTIEWDSVTGKPTTIEWDSVTGKPTTIEWDSVTGKPTTIEWDSVAGRPTLLSQFTNDLTITWDSVIGHRDSLSLFVNDITLEWDSVLNKPTTIEWDSVLNKPTTIEWDSVAGRPTLLSQFTNNISIKWDSITNAPTRLSQFNNDLTLHLGAGDTLYIGDSTQKICLRPLHTLSLPWDRITYRPDSLSQFHNDLGLRFYNDTLFLVGDSTVKVSLRALRPTSFDWSNITHAPTKLSDFNNDLRLHPNLSHDTLFFPTFGDTVDLSPLRTITLPWTSITQRPTRLSDGKIIDDLENIKVHDTIFLHNRKDTILLHRSSLYTHWDSIVARPAWVDTAHYLGTTTSELRIHNLVNPTVPTDAANKQYVDARAAALSLRINDLEDSIAMLKDKISALEHPVIPGMLPGQFSVSPTKKVVFSQGNLQYHPKWNLFRFAANQKDFYGLLNNAAAQEGDGTQWLDLFGYGTSGWNGGRGYYYMPYEIRDNNEMFMVDRANGNDLTGDYANCDWGRYNTIVNGGNKPSEWRTLTKAEWIYLLEQRPNASSRKAMGRIGTTAGLILLPDNWTAPAGLSVNTQSMSLGTYNDFTDAQWAQLEAAGAVFLPVAGWRERSTTTVDNVNGYYWSASHDNTTQATSIRVRTDVGVTPQATNCSQACSVRLVRDY